MARRSPEGPYRETKQHLASGAVALTRVLGDLVAARDARVSCRGGLRASSSGPASLHASRTEAGRISATLRLRLGETLTEITAGTLLRVIETGFASLHGTAEEQDKAVEENTEGWTSERASSRSTRNGPLRDNVLCDHAPVQQPIIVVATLTAMSPRRPGGTPNRAGSAEMSTRRTL